MNIGIQYTTYDDVSFVLYALRHGKIKADFLHEGIWGPGHTGKRFEIYFNDDCYIFSDYYPDIEGCDRKLHASHNQLEFDSRYHKGIFTPKDCFTHPIEDIKNFLHSGSLYLSYMNLDYKHDNVIFYPLFSLVQQYYELGFKFFNYYQNDRKLHLLGTYHKPVHIGGCRMERRNYIFDKVKNILQDDLKHYTSPESDFDLLLDSYRYFGQWFNAHMAGYSDFNTSVCNMLFETYDSLGSYSHENRIMVTEKTTKGLLFSKENIFFIWYGHQMFIPYLKDYGFWFLNFEFYNHNDSVGKNTAILQSVFKTVEYLKELKNTYKTNNAVYQHLMNKYGHKLENNGRLFDNLINNCDTYLRDNIIDMLKH